MEKFIFSMSAFLLVGEEDIGECRNVKELYEEVGKRVGTGTSIIQLYKAKRVKNDSLPCTGRIGFVINSESEYVILQKQNLHLQEKLNRTVEALLTLQSQQQPYHDTKTTLRQELEKINKNIADLETSLEKYERKTEGLEESIEKKKICK